MKLQANYRGDFFFLVGDLLIDSMQDVFDK